ncbi:MAG: L-threonylcarbamoyladenylate synthase [bacterium]|nr:L-threonylcarbamoyladenylate synthase [bacterium]
MLEILKVKKNNLKEIIKIAAEFIKAGKIIVFPTDTVYGLICDATNKKAVAKLFRIKKRDKKKPLPIFVKDIKMAKKIAKIDKKQEKFLESVWPGKVTAVLERKKMKKNIYGVDKRTIALRIPKYGLLLSLAKQLNRPFTGTSANISGGLASTKIQEVVNQFKGQRYQPDLIIDGGSLNFSKPSTVVDITNKNPKIIRK